jgi:hypothetical protein
MPHPVGVWETYPTGAADRVPETPADRTENTINQHAAALAGCKSEKALIPLPTA